MAAKKTVRQPLPGRSVRGSRTGRPIMALLDLLGRRWCLRILWELREGALGFRELQARCEAMSPSVLSQRLAELQAAGIVEVAAQGYRLSQEGQVLRETLGPLGAWAERWAVRTRKDGQQRLLRAPAPVPNL